MTSVKKPTGIVGTDGTDLAMVIFVMRMVTVIQNGFSLVLNILKKCVE
jgi:hypothetical protein